MIQLTDNSSINKTKVRFYKIDFLVGTGGLELLTSCMSKTYINFFPIYYGVFFSVLENLIGKVIRNFWIAGLVHLCVLISLNINILFLPIIT